jgi:D-alanyl-D-alanine carboxypeptidase
LKKRGLIRTLTLALAFNAVAVPVLAQRHRAEPIAQPDRYASLVMDEETGRVLYERNADHQLHPASTTKLMTAYLTLKAMKDGKLTLDQELNVSDWAASQPATNLFMKQDVTVKETVTQNGKKVVVTHVQRRQTIKTITVENALRGMLCHSANDAAVVFAEAIGGSQANFVRLMNAEAQRLGMTHTHFANPNGLPDNTNKTTVEDMAKLARALIEDFPEDYKYFSIRSFTFNGRTFQNTNHLLGVYPGLDGMKTGWIASSGFNLVASAKRGDIRVIGVVFGANVSEARNEDMKRLLDFAFQKEKNPKLRFTYGPLAARNKPERTIEFPPKPEVPQPPAIANNVPAPPPPAPLLTPVPLPLPDSIPAPKETASPPLVSLPPKASGATASPRAPS